MTRLGWGAGAAGTVLLVVGLAARWAPVLVLGAGLCVLVVGAVVYVVRSPRLQLERAVEPPRVEKGQPAIAVVQATNRSWRAVTGLVIEQRIHHQITGEPMKFLTLADWTGMVETELFAQTYKSYGLATVRYPVLEVTATVEPFENGRGFSLRVWRAGKPRNR